MEIAQKAMLVKNVCHTAKAVHGMRNPFSKTQKEQSGSVFRIVRDWPRRRRGRKTVYVYSGLGTTHTYFENIFNSLTTSLDQRQHCIRSISPEEVIAGDWRTDCAALVFGGGYASGFLHALGSKGVKHVRDFVTQDGGSYIGVCAGAYFACDYVEFDKGGKHEVCLHRPLRLYPGTCKGPVSPHYDRFTDKGARVLPVSFRLPSPGAPTRGRDDDNAAAGVTNHGSRRNNDVTVTVSACVNGGGIFLPHPRKSSASNDDDNNNNDDGDDARVCETLAYFQTLEHQPAAIVKSSVGKNGGVAVLLSPHLEGFASRRDDVTRQRCWRWVLRQGRLATERSSPLPFFVPPEARREADTAHYTVLSH